MEALNYERQFMKSEYKINKDRYECYFDGYNETYQAGVVSKWGRTIK